MRTKTTLLNSIRSAFRNRFAESLLIPLTRGKRWDHWMARIPANYYQYKPGSLRHVQRHGHEFILDLSEYMQWLIYFGVETEPRNALYSLVKPGMHVLDVGANIGETTLEFSRLVHENGRVISFEPFPETFSRLQMNLALNKDRTNVTAINAALGEQRNTMFMQTESGNSGGNRIASSGGTIPVDVIPLDEWLKSHPEIKPALIKIDVEGFEMKVLRGANETLRKYSPALFMEVNPEFLKRAGNSAEELLTYLAGHGYTFHDAESNTPITATQTLSKTHFDLIARKK